MPNSARRAAMESVSRLGHNGAGVVGHFFNFWDFLGHPRDFLGHFWTTFGHFRVVFGPFLGHFLTPEKSIVCPFWVKKVPEIAGSAHFSVC